MKPNQEPIPAVLRKTSSRLSGLTDTEAVARGKGQNKLPEEKKTPLFLRFFAQMADPMTLTLLGAAAVSGVTAYLTGESYADVFIILFVVFVNAFLGVLQESKAEKALDALKKMTPPEAKVLRDGAVTKIPAEDLVTGDIVLLEAGDAIPADGRVIEAAMLKTEEAALTGESDAILKTTETLTGDDRRNTVCMGSTVVYGRGKAVVTAIGSQTEMGGIAHTLSEAANERTPLQKKLGRLSITLTKAVLGICVFLFLFSAWRDGDFSGTHLLDTFLVAVSLAVAAIPEGLAAVVTIVLSVGVTKMSGRNAIIRRLTAVETLGCTQVICTDKTGTLTQNRMTVSEVWGDAEELTKGMALCSDAEPGKDGTVEGEPTECALVRYAENRGYAKARLKAEFPRVAEIPFDSVRKRMTTFHRDGQKIVQYTKGAPDLLLPLCGKIRRNGQILPLDGNMKAEIEQTLRTLSSKALRVLALAEKYPDSLPSRPSEKDETGLVFVGFAGMADPVRPQVKTAVEKCQKAGIRTVMITGDHVDTAVAVAEELDLISDRKQAVTGEQLDRMTDDELKRDIGQYTVFARVRPAHKVRIVRAWKARGKITAMTGDGVNDAPALKSADIGVGMGITGTDVTKNVADMILADDDFSTIVKAVEEGRRIYDNIRKAIQFLLSSNLSEVLAVFLSTLLGFTILQPAQILWINLITDSFPALALGMEQGEPGLMERKPRPEKEGLFSGGAGGDILYQGVLVTVLTLLSCFLGGYLHGGVWRWTGTKTGTTMAFLTMSMAELFHAFNLRSRTQSVFRLKGHNPWLYAALTASILLTAAVIYVPPVAALFGFTALSAVEYLTAMGLAFAVIPAVECVKFLHRR